MSKRIRTKISYFPGIISLTILPVIFINLAKQNIRSLTVSAIPLVILDTAFLKMESLVFKNLIKKYPPKRKYIDIQFTGDNLNDRIKLDFAQVSTRELVSSKDYEYGIRFRFGDSSSYWTFVKAVDVLRFEGAKTFAPIDNEIWFYNLKPDSNTTEIFPRCLLCNDVQMITHKDSWYRKTTKKISLIWKTSWKIIVNFIFFIFVVVVLELKKNFSTHSN